MITFILFHALNDLHFWKHMCWNNLHSVVGCACLLDLFLFTITLKLCLWTSLACKSSSCISYFLSCTEIASSQCFYFWIKVQCLWIFMELNKILIHEWEMDIFVVEIVGKQSCCVRTALASYVHISYLITTVPLQQPLLFWRNCYIFIIIHDTILYI